MEKNRIIKKFGSGLSIEIRNLKLINSSQLFECTYPELVLGYYSYNGVRGKLKRTKQRMINSL